LSRIVPWRARSPGAAGVGLATPRVSTQATPFPRQARITLRSFRRWWPTASRTSARPSTSLSGSHPLPGPPRTTKCSSPCPSLPRTRALAATRFRWAATSSRSPNLARGTSCANTGDRKGTRSGPDAPISRATQPSAAIGQRMVDRQRRNRCHSSRACAGVETPEQRRTIAP